MRQKEKKKRLAILCSGLGHISRGFEISADEWYQHLKNSKTLSVKLFAGGKKEFAKKVMNVPRNSMLANILRKFKLIHDGFLLEQLSFGLGFLFHLIFYKPDIIWLQEPNLADFLLKIRNVFKFRYKIIFCDGAPVGYKVASKFDYIIFLHTYAYDEAVCNNVSPSKCTVIPYIRSFSDPVTKESAREFFNFPNNKFVILCVAAWNIHHKRIDYLLKEIATLNKAELILMLCGQPENETEDLKAFAKANSVDTLWLTLEQNELSKAYDVADIFILSSLREGLPGVLVEAGIHGLPIICHIHPGGKFILGEEYEGLTDLSIKGNLSRKIVELKENDLSKLGRYTKKIVSKKFDPKVLTEKFEAFINEIILGKG
jgi:1,2-diacylglycerol 3-alpha-glucosyltransferase